MTVAKKDVHMSKHQKLADKDEHSCLVIKAITCSASRLGERVFCLSAFPPATLQTKLDLRVYLHLPLETVPDTLHLSPPGGGVIYHTGEQTTRYTTKIISKE